MARYKVDQTSEFPYHITARCPNRAAYPLPLSEIWTLFEVHLGIAHYKNDLKILAFTLMPNHFHLIASVGEIPIGKVMSELLGGISRDINCRAHRMNQNWGGRHYKCVLEKELHFINTYKYVYQNPLRAGLVLKLSDWPYSTLHGVLGFSKLSVPLSEDTILFNPHFDENALDWLCRMSEPQHLEMLRKALRKRTFKPPWNRSQLSHILDTQRI